MQATMEFEVTESIVKAMTLPSLIEAVRRTHGAWSSIGGNPEIAVEMIEAQKSVWGTRDAKFSAISALSNGGGLMTLAEIKAVLA